MSTLTIGKLVSRETSSRSAARHPAPRLDLAQKSFAVDALEAAGRIVLHCPRTTSFIVISLALILGSLAGMSFGGFRRSEPPPLVRLVTLKPHHGAVGAGLLPAGYDSCQPPKQASCRVAAGVVQPER